MDIKNIQEILVKHSQWLRGEEDGVRAYLYRANLYRANLSGANLSEANLSEANLSGADLSGADLYRANLSGANLSEANLSEANLSEANLSRAHLWEANLSGANLSGANLSGANLSGANLSGANLSGANLREANLSVIKHDIWSILIKAQSEIPGLVEAIKQGRINGSVYEGDCACLVGTIAKIKCVPYRDLGVIKPDADRPAERWFLAIREGDTPENSVIAKLTLEWIEEFASYLPNHA